MLEFTGERVVPGVADPDLLNEHTARYRFAAHYVRRFGPEAVILDAGCGTGYGTAEFAVVAASVTAFDISGEAVKAARDLYARPGVRWLQAGCESLPFADGSFDLVVAFEVIEHLERWRELLSEAKRVLKPSGVLLVSTPNKAYYAESRAEAGPNPFHVHEFEYDEFCSALAEIFPHTSLWTQNHTGSIAFLPSSPSGGVLDAPDHAEPGNAHFYLAACGNSPLPPAEGFAYLPASGNILRTRERHIALLNEELRQKTVWLTQLEASHAALNDEHSGVLAELRERNTWGTRLTEEAVQSGARILQLQDEIASSHARYGGQIADLEREAEARLKWIQDLESRLTRGVAKIADLEREAGTRLAWIDDLESQIARGSGQIANLEREADARLAWIHDLESQIARGVAEIERLNLENTELRAAFEERTKWGESIASELERERRVLTAALQATEGRLRTTEARLEEILAAIDASRWMRLGRTLHLGPDTGGNTDR